MGECRGGELGVRIWLTRDHIQGDGPFLIAGEESCPSWGWVGDGAERSPCLGQASCATLPKSSLLFTHSSSGLPLGCKGVALGAGGPHRERGALGWARGSGVQL